MFESRRSFIHRLLKWGRQVRALTGWDATQVLRKLQIAEGQERWRLATTLNTVRLHDSHIRQIILLMDLPDVLLRWGLEDVLITQGGRQVVSQCRTRLRSGGDVGGTVGCLRVLGALQAREALEEIVMLATHSDTHVRVAVADALQAFLDDVRAQEALLNLLADRTPAVRRAAVWALRRSQSPWADSVLAALVESSHEPWVETPGVPQTSGVPAQFLPD